MPPFHVNVEDDFSASREGFMITIHGKPIPKKRYNPIRRYNPSRVEQEQFNFQAKHNVRLAWHEAFHRELWKGGA